MGKASDFIARLKSVRHIELIAGGLLLVAVLAVYFSCASCASDKSEKTSTVPSGADYCTSMQIQLESVVSQISGVGDASVVINWDKSTSNSFANTQTENPKATGVIVVCAGGDSTKVKLDVIYAVSTLLDLSIEKIIVYPKSN